MAYNIAANQILARPVTSAYEGRAIRQSLKAGEQEYREAEQAMRMNEQVMEQRSADLERKRLENAEMSRIIEARDAYNQSIGNPEAMEQVKAQYPEYYAERRESDYNRAIERFSAADEVVQGIENEEQWNAAAESGALDVLFGGDTPAYNAQIVSGLRDFSGTLIGDMRDIKVLEDAGLETEAKVMRDRLALETQNLQAEIAYRRAQAAAQTALAGTRNATRPTGSPATGPQLDQAERAVQGDELFEELTEEDKGKFIDTIANRAKEILEAEGGNYTDALNKAIAETKKYIQDTPEEERRWYAPDPEKVFRPNSGVVTITSDAEYDALPSGTRFIDPEGTTRTKP